MSTPNNNIMADDKPITPDSITPGPTGNPYEEVVSQGRRNSLSRSITNHSIRSNPPHEKEIYADEKKDVERQDSMTKNDIEAREGTIGSDEVPTPTRNPTVKFKRAVVRGWHTHRSAIRVATHVFIGALMTAWWIAGLILHRDDFGWLIPFLLWLCVAIRLVTFYIPSKFFFFPVKFAWIHIVQKGVQIIPEKLRLPLGAAGAIGVFLLGTFIDGETADNTRASRAQSCFGLIVILGVFYITSNNPSKIVWHTVIVGMLAQFILALFVLRSQAGYDIFDFIAYLASKLLGFAAVGAEFLVGKEALGLGWWVFGVLPPIIFFIAFVQLLYYYGWLQFFIGKFAIIFFWGMRVSGAEAVVAAASPFVGQGESVMLIKPFIPHLTDAEIHQVMTSGFATIAGSVLAAYIFMGINPQALISSCVMSIPASLAISKLRWPETEETLTSGRIVIPAPDESEEKPQNALHAFANGGWLGLKVAGMIAASLLIILSLLALINGLLTWWGQYLNIGSRNVTILEDGTVVPDPYNLTIDLILGYLFYPVAWLLGVRKDDLLEVGKLIGIKVIANEFVAFARLVSPEVQEQLSPRSRLIATYALCGFGNLSSVAIQIGVLSQLAPSKGGKVAKVAFSALFSGIFATLTSATVAGMLISDSGAFSTTA